MGILDDLRKNHAVPQRDKQRERRLNTIGLLTDEARGVKNTKFSVSPEERQALKDEVGTPEGYVRLYEDVKARGGDDSDFDAIAGALQGDATSKISALAQGATLGGMDNALEMSDSPNAKAGAARFRGAAENNPWTNMAGGILPAAAITAASGPVAGMAMSGASKIIPQAGNLSQSIVQAGIAGGAQGALSDFFAGDENSGNYLQRAGHALAAGVPSALMGAGLQGVANYAANKGAGFSTASDTALSGKLGQQSAETSKDAMVSHMYAGSDPKLVREAAMRAELADQAAGLSHEEALAASIANDVKPQLFGNQAREYANYVKNFEEPQANIYNQLGSQVIPDEQLQRAMQDVADYNLNPSNPGARPSEVPMMRRSFDEFRSKLPQGKAKKIELQESPHDDFSWPGVQRGQPAAPSQAEQLAPEPGTAGARPSRMPGGLGPEPVTELEKTAISKPMDQRLTGLQQDWDTVYAQGGNLEQTAISPSRGQFSINDRPSDFGSYAPDNVPMLQPEQRAAVSQNPLPAKAPTNLRDINQQAIDAADRSYAAGFKGPTAESKAWKSVVDKIDNRMTVADKAYRKTKLVGDFAASKAGAERSSFAAGANTPFGAVNRHLTSGVAEAVDLAKSKMFGSAAEKAYNKLANVTGDLQLPGGDVVPLWKAQNWQRMLSKIAGTKDEAVSIYALRGADPAFARFMAMTDEGEE